jgi:hypothetical protein|tara:strand:+ start:260 stop:496 length:237 start_codon:yes stop_codon:yes gene_type:complete
MDNKFQVTTESAECYTEITSVTLVVNTNELVYNGKSSVVLEDGRIVETVLGTQTLTLPEDSQIVAELLLLFPNNPTAG